MVGPKTRKVEFWSYRWSKITWVAEWMLSSEHLGMPESLAQLRHAQAAFETKRADYQSRRGVMRSSESATVLKGLIREQLNAVLIPHFQVMDSVKGGSYSEFNTTVREVVASANLTASQHRSRKKATAHDETQAEPRQSLEEGGLFGLTFTLFSMLKLIVQKTNS